MPLWGEVRRHASLSGARAAADGSQLFTAFSNNQARDDDDDAARLCRFGCAAAPRAGMGARAVTISRPTCGRADCVSRKTF